MKQYKIGVIVGSLRKDSVNRKVAKALMENAPSNLKLEFVEIGDLPFYNEDLDTQGDNVYTEFRNKLNAKDAFLFVTPEYNRSFPGVLKNATDVGSRPWKQGALNNKPAAVVSVTPGGLGAVAANHHLRQVLTSLNMPTMGQPEAYIGNAFSLFDENGKLINENTKEFFTQFMQAFAKHIEKNLG